MDKFLRYITGLLFLLNVGSIANAQVWDERPVASYEDAYRQIFNYSDGWDRFKFYEQWKTLQNRIFNATDISTGALQFKWIEKRVMCSRKKYYNPYILEVDYDYYNGSIRGGVVIRIGTFSESIQEPDSDPGFNREGIAFYPTGDGSSMIVQFSGEDKGSGGGTAFTRINVPKPTGVTSLKNRAKLRIEDFGSSIYVFYNNSPFIRIELNNKNQEIYAAGTVYNSSMQLIGSFSGMEVEEFGHVAVAQRDAKLRLYAASVKYTDTENVFNAADTVIFESAYRDLYEDSWLATDDLGRELPGFNTVGPIKKDKQRVVGIFYVTWHTEDKYTRFTSPYAADVSKILATDPSARLDANHPLWATNSFHWGEPEMGYFLSQDEYVIRKDMAMLANAGVDVLIMDVTNAVRYWDEWEVLFTTMQKMKAEGNKVPKFCFWAFNGPVITVVQDLYDWFYQTERYKDLWFYWDGKPLLLYNANPSTDATGGGYKNPNPNYDPDAISNPSNPNYGDPFYTSEYLTDYTQKVKDFFTTRNMWWGYYEWAGKRYIGTEDNWSFGYDLGHSKVRNLNPDQLIATHNGVKEQAAVTPAQHPSSLVGKSWSRANGEPELNQYDLPKSAYVSWLGQTVQHPEAYGIYFQDRWNEALSSDPMFIYINDWNEWTAGKYHTGAVPNFMRRSNSPYFFVDQYNAEFNRAVQPMKDGYSDNYYMQMIQNIRRYKGVRRHVNKKKITPITIDNNYSDWEKVTDEFRDAIGDTRHRSHNGYGGLHYTNETGRNDIMTSKVAYDENNVYFYVETVRDMTAHSDANWMLLLINSDKNRLTGWEGYDYIINKDILSSTQTTLQKWEDGKWSNPVDIPFSYQKNQMEISIPMNQLGLNKDEPGFYFKWVDNPGELVDVSAFFNDGEAAPDRRFKYHFNPIDTTSFANQTLHQPTIVKIFPNPASNGRVFIEMPDCTKVEAFNLNGCKVFENEHVGDMAEVDVSLWNSGIYVLRLSKDDKSFYKKLIIE